MSRFFWSFSMLHGVLSSEIVCAQSQLYISFYYVDDAIEIMDTKKKIQNRKQRMLF